MPLITQDKRKPRAVKQQPAGLLGHDRITCWLFQDFGICINRGKRKEVKARARTESICVGTGKSCLAWVFSPAPLGSHFPRPRAKTSSVLLSGPGVQRHACRLSHPVCRHSQAATARRPLALPKGYPCQLDWGPVESLCCESHPGVFVLFYFLFVFAF